jgi:hypothetical protein
LWMISQSSWKNNMKRNSIAWHENCLKNSLAYERKLYDEVSALLATYNTVVIQNNLRLKQIRDAKANHLTEFDADKYLIPRKKKGALHDVKV